MRAPLPLTQLAELDLSAASGIAERAGRLFVIADDELALAIYDRRGKPLGRLPLLPGELPREPRERKAYKPDFEALVTLPDGALLALGSGSSERRRVAVRIADPERPGQPQAVALDPLYERLERELPELNIEGAAIYREQLILCSRGNGVQRDNALIGLDLARTLAALERGACPAGDALRSIQRVELGELLGAPLSLTDLAVVAGRLVFSAAAEASPNTYDDGVCTGSVLGIVSASAQVHHVVAVAPPVKIEGVAAISSEDGGLSLLLVADADDPGLRAPLFEVDAELLLM